MRYSLLTSRSSLRSFVSVRDAACTKGGEGEGKGEEVGKGRECEMRKEKYAIEIAERKQDSLVT